MTDQPRKTRAELRRILVLLAVAAPLLVWAANKRSRWEGADRVRSVKIVPLESAKLHPVDALYALPESAWRGEIVDSPLTRAGGSSQPVIEETGEEAMGPEWIWERTRIQYRPSAGAAWKDHALPRNTFWSSRSPGQMTAPLKPGQWKETLKASFELYTASERVAWRGEGTRENIITVTSYSNRAYLLEATAKRRRREAEDARMAAIWERQERVRQAKLDKQWEASRKKMYADNDRIAREQERYRNTDQRVARLEWRPVGKGAWRPVPAKGSPDYPLTRPLTSTIELRPVKKLSDRPWPTVYPGGIYWERDGLRSEFGEPEHLTVAADQNLNPPVAGKPARSRTVDIAIVCNSVRVPTRIHFAAPGKP